MIRAESVCAVAAARFAAAASAQTPRRFSLLRPAIFGRNRRERTGESLGARLPARRPHAGDRAPGRLRIVTRDGKLSPPVAGVPKVFARGQGGLLDVILDRDFAQNRTIYFCYAEPVGGGARTAMARARLVDEGTPQLDDVQVHLPAGRPALERQPFRLPHRADAGRQSLPHDGRSLHARATRRRISPTIIGKIVRLAPDGSVPHDNPFVGRQGAKPEIWSYGHRNSQGAAINPASRKVLDARARPARRRRDQHPGGRQELRLAGDRLRHRL